jgi:hypothetical protein
MEAIQFEGLKVALKQDKNGFMLTLSIHPDEIPDALVRDFVGARYGVAMVRIDDNQQPLDRREFDGSKYVRMAGMLAKNEEFWEYLADQALVFEQNENAAVEWLRTYLNIQSRSELMTSPEARALFDKLIKEFNTWKQKRS